MKKILCDWSVRVCLISRKHEGYNGNAKLGIFKGNATFDLMCYSWLGRGEILCILMIMKCTRWVQITKPQMLKIFVDFTAKLMASQYWLRREIWKIILQCEKKLIEKLT